MESGAFYGVNRNRAEVKFLFSAQVSVYLSGVMPKLCKVLHSPGLNLEEKELAAQGRQSTSHNWTDSAK